MIKKGSILTLSLLLLLTACGTDNKEQKGDLRPLSEKERGTALNKIDKKIVQAENSFALKLHEQMIQSEGNQDNLVFSPYSISTALALAYNGSAGETAAEMQQALGWSGLTPERLNEGNSQLKLLLERGSGVVLNTANSVWVQDGFELKESYLNGVKQSYEAEVGSADLSSDAFVKEYNGWVEQKTDGMIKEMFTEPPGGIAVLANAIYFDGDWKDKFNPEHTTEENFTLPDGMPKRVPMMNILNDFDYKETEDWQAIRIPYEDGAMHMLIILPRETYSLQELHQQLWKDPSIWQNEFSHETVDLGLPRFTADSRMNVTDMLKRLGIKQALDPDMADFSGMAEVPLYITAVNHKAVIDVSEKGTVAAASTNVGMDAGAAPSEPVEMTVNRPFFFAIEERDTGAWIFIGSMNQL